MLSLVVVLITLLLAFTLHKVISNLYFSPLAKFPGPKLWAISSIPHLLTLQLGKQHSKTLQLHLKYGKIVRIRPDEISVIDEAVWKDVWAYRQGHAEFFKDRNNIFPHPNGLRGILTAEKETHARYRRLFGPSFSERGMREQEGTVLEYVDALMRGIKKQSLGGEALDMVEWFNWTTFDVIGRLAFGEDFGCLENATMHPWIEMIFKSLKSILTMANLRQLGIDEFLLYMAPKKMLEARLKNWAFVSDRVESRVKQDTSPADFFSSILKQHGEERGMTIEEMKSNASNFVLAGSETTATLLSGAVHLLLQNPPALEKATAEIRSAFSNANEIDFASASKLEYTIAVLEESLRLYPPVPNLFGREVPIGGATVCNHFLPHGTIVHFPMFAAYRYPPYFHDVEKFCPERWMGHEKFRNDNLEVFQPFSVGTRNCIGKNLARAEMRVILARLLFCFDIERGEKWEEGWMDQKTFILWEKRPLWVKLKAVS